MENLSIRGLTFTYAGADRPQLEDITLDVARGEFLTVVGPSGCGKSTLLKLLHPGLAPRGTGCGEILLDGQPVESLSREEMSRRIGLVGQFPERQLLTDKVWHELAFGLESLGVPSGQIRSRVGEIANFFGIRDWFDRDTDSLSGGQKQILNLASVMVAEPELLLLDEPTSQLDPVASGEFLSLLGRIHRELGTTIVLASQRPEEAFALTDRVLLLADGRIRALGRPDELGPQLGSLSEDLAEALPVPARLALALGGTGDIPWTVSQGRRWFAEKMRERREAGENAAVSGRNGRRNGGDADTEVSGGTAGETARESAAPRAQENAAQNTRGNADSDASAGTVLVSCREIFVRYSKEGADVLSGLSVEARSGEIVGILGANGAGKSTLLKVLCGRLKPYRGELKLSGTAAMLPQEAELLFLEETVQEELRRAVPSTCADPDAEIARIVRLCRLEGLLARHPYDLSGGERQRAALSKLLLADPEILLLDEPTRGIDGGYKKVLGAVLKELAGQGRLILLVTHDVEFCAETADRCGLLFDGDFTEIAPTRTFFCHQSILTTAVRRMTREHLADAILIPDVLKALGAEEEKKSSDSRPGGGSQSDAEAPADLQSEAGTPGDLQSDAGMPRDLQSDAGRQGGGKSDAEPFSAETAATLPQRTFGAAAPEEGASGDGWKRLISLLCLLVLIPVTLWWGLKGDGNRHYMLVSVLVVLEGLVPMFLRLERRGLKARELVLFSAMIGIAVAGRAALFMLPEMKPVAAVTMICAAGFGGEAGFLVGSLSMLISNAVFTQGAFTPWQMFAMGLLGWVSGVLFRHVPVLRKRGAYAALGFILVAGFYGITMNAFSMLYMGVDMSLTSFLAFEATGIALDAVHGLATAFFLWIGLEPFLAKFTRLQTRYGFYGAVQTVKPF